MNVGRLLIDSRTINPLSSRQEQVDSYRNKFILTAYHQKDQGCLLYDHLLQRFKQKPSFEKAVQSISREDFFEVLGEFQRAADLPESNENSLVIKYIAERLAVATSNGVVSFDAFYSFLSYCQWPSCVNKVCGEGK